MRHPAAWRSHHESAPRSAASCSTPDCAARALAFARTCYDHLAGQCGVELHDALLRQGWLSDGYVVTSAGTEALAEWGVDAAAARALRRTFARPCLDWTERRPHLAGGLAASITDALLERGWFARRSADSRALRVTEAGTVGLARLGCRLMPASPTPTHSSDSRS